MNIHILAVGRLKKGPQRELFDEYQKRLEWSFKLTELEGHNTAEEHKKIFSALTDDAYVVALDERGKSLSSRKFSAVFEKLQNEGRANIQFVLGGADGLSDQIRQRADLLLSFGAQTWPHMLARVMLLEQIYRSQQILKNHPYHRD